MFGIIELKKYFVNFSKYVFIFRNVEEYCKDLGDIIKFQDTVKKPKNNIGKFYFTKSVLKKGI